MEKCFNPTLVRFCRGARSQPPAAWSGFQSHLGSILPGTPTWRFHASTRFQSHLGSILPKELLVWSVTERGFNPTLVRFCPGGAVAGGAGSGGFQSHLGSILPDLPPITRSPRSPCFNPTLVRFCHWRRCAKLQRYSRFNPTLVRFCRNRGVSDVACRAVSIPPWFDFARSRRRADRRFH